MKRSLLATAAFLSCVSALASGTGRGPGSDVDCHAGMNFEPITLERSPSGHFLIALEDPHFQDIDVMIDPRIEEERFRVYLYDFKSKSMLNVWTHGFGHDQVVQLTLPGKEIWVSCELVSGGQR